MFMLSPATITRAVCIFLRFHVCVWVTVCLASESSLAFPRDGAGTTKGHSFIHESAVEAGRVSYSNWSDEQSPRMWNKHVETWMFSHCSSVTSPSWSLCLPSADQNCELHHQVHLWGFTNVKEYPAVFPCFSCLLSLAYQLSQLPARGRAFPVQVKISDLRISQSNQMNILTITMQPYCEKLCTLTSSR